MGLMDSLGLDNVEADPNALPDGTYGVTLFKAGVIATKRDDVAVMLVFKCNDGSGQNGKEKPEFFTLGHGPKYDENKVVVGFDTATMKDVQKSYFKKRLIEIGIPESKHNEVDNALLQDMIGTDFYMTVYNKNGYCNISKITSKTAGGADPFVNPTTPQATTSPTASGGNVSDLI